jgi:hypothetical protein
MAAAPRQSSGGEQAVRKMSVFQRRGMATSPLWWGSIVAGRGGEGSMGGRRHERPQFLE